MKTQALSRLKEVAELRDFEIKYSFKDPSGHGIASGTQVIPAATAEGARNSFLTRWKYRDNTHKGPVNIQSVKDKGPRRPRI